METVNNIIRCSLDEVGGLLAGHGKIFILCDRNVRYVADRICIPEGGLMEIEATEQGKTFQTVMEIDRWLMENGADRNAFVLGIGGGVTTDITGFAASIYKRGVKFGFIPTTLLSQVDAAIGGKNGVNLDSFKNMMGVFRLPEVVFICPEPLKTLPESQILSGASELFKTFIINNEGSNYERAVTLFKSSGTYSAALGELVAKAAFVKAGIVELDPEEHGERRLLNLGHTFAHAIEKESDERICHGDAVSMGIILSARLSEKLGTAQPGFAQTLEDDFKACGLKTACPFEIGRLTEAMKKDKKAEGSSVHFVLPIKIGQVETRDLDPEYVTKLLED